MADVTNGLGFRKLETQLIAGLYYFATLHSAMTALVSSLDTYAATGLNEMPTANGYTLGGIALGVGSVVTNTNVDVPDAVWTAATNTLGPVAACALWCNTTNTITGARFIMARDSSTTPQSSSAGQTMTGGIVNPIQY
jgi:hypothetical protein